MLQLSIQTTIRAPESDAAQRHALKEPDMTYVPPVVDLDRIRNESELLPLVKQILASHDSFLLQNFANIELAEQLLNEVLHQASQQPAPQNGAGLDADFSGTLAMGSYTLQQWLLKDASRPEQLSSTLRRLYSILNKIGTYFARLCVQASGNDVAAASLRPDLSSTVCLHHSTFSDHLLDMQFDYSETDHIDFESVGLLSVIPNATCAKVYRNDSWHSINVENCLLIHTGNHLAKISNGFHTTSKIRLSTNSLAITIQPPLSDRSFSEELLRINLTKFPDTGELHYPLESRMLNLRRCVSFLKTLFSTIESMINLYKINHPGTDFVELEKLLPSISRMMKTKVTSLDFQRLLYIWPQAYDIDVNSNCGISFKLQTTLSLTRSRTLDFSEKIEQWLSTVEQQQSQSPNGSEIPENVPILKLGKRKVSNSSINYSAPLKSINRRRLAKLKGSATKNSVLFTPMANEVSAASSSSGQDVASSTSLIDRIRDKERRAAALLSRRQSMQEHFLAVKMKHVFEICFTLEPEIPYTEEYLTSLIVDSLTDTQNPLGKEECVQVLANLSNLLGQDTFQALTVEGNMKVYKWIPLDKTMLE